MGSLGGGRESDVARDGRRHAAEDEVRDAHDVPLRVQEPRVRADAAGEEDRAAGDVARVEGGLAFPMQN